MAAVSVKRSIVVLSSHHTNEEILETNRVNFFNDDKYVWWIFRFDFVKLTTR